jgi:16S rRNA (guanine1207-N2)-methyltransferase
VRLVDEILVGALPKAPPRFLLTGLDSEAAVARAGSSRYPDARVAWFHHDLFVAGLARFQGWDRERMLVESDLPQALATDLAPDSPERPDLVAFPFPKGGEALFAREILEEAHDALALGGRLLAATDGDPAWLKKVTREVFRNAEVTASPIGAVVIAERKRAAAVLKDHSHVVKLSHGGRQFEFRTRPGVFSYGHVDQGSKALLFAADFTGCRRILDIGCGAGVLGIVGAIMSRDASAVLVDSNVRAVALARENASRNGAGGVEAVAWADPLSVMGGPFDCVLANPPYFANFKIAEKFIVAAHRLLDLHGRLWLVAKAAEEHAIRVDRVFGNADLRIVGDYGVVSAIRR